MNKISNTIGGTAGVRTKRLLALQKYKKPILITTTSNPSISQFFVVTPDDEGKPLLQCPSTILEEFVDSPNHNDENSKIEVYVTSSQSSSPCQDRLITPTAPKTKLSISTNDNDGNNLDSVSVEQDSALGTAEENKAKDDHDEEAEDEEKGKRFRWCSSDEKDEEVPTQLTNTPKLVPSDSSEESSDDENHVTDLNPSSNFQSKVHYNVDEKDDTKYLGEIFNGTTNKCRNNTKSMDSVHLLGGSTNTNTKLGRGVGFSFPKPILAATIRTTTTMILSNRDENRQSLLSEWKKTASATTSAAASGRNNRRKSTHNRRQSQEAEPQALAFDLDNVAICGLDDFYDEPSPKPKTNSITNQPFDPQLQMVNNVYVLPWQQQLQQQSLPALKNKAKLENNKKALKTGVNSISVRAGPLGLLRGPSRTVSEQKTTNSNENAQEEAYEIEEEEAKETTRFLPIQRYRSQPYQRTRSYRTFRKCSRGLLQQQQQPLLSNSKKSNKSQRSYNEKPIDEGYVMRIGSHDNKYNSSNTSNVNAKKTNKKKSRKSVVACENTAAEVPMETTNHTSTSVFTTETIFSEDNTTRLTQHRLSSPLGSSPSSPKTEQVEDDFDAFQSANIPDAPEVEETSHVAQTASLIAPDYDNGKSNNDDQQHHVASPTGTTASRPQENSNLNATTTTTTTGSDKSNQSREEDCRSGDDNTSLSSLTWSN